MFRKVLCVLLALVCLGTAAFAESTEDLEARIAELEAQVELYKPYYDAQVIVEYDGGVIFKDAVEEEYSYYESMYSQYGIDLVSYGLESTVKQQAAETLMENAAMDVKAAELGLDVLSDETVADLEAQANEIWESYIQTIAEQLVGEDQTVEDVRDAAISYLETYYSYTYEGILEDYKTNYIDQLLYDYVTADVTVSDEETQAAYEEQVESDKSSYATDSTYVSARNNGTVIAWNPEGYRAVKQVLIKFDDDQTARYDELTDELETLNTALEAAQNPEEPAEETTEETAEEATEAEETRTVEEIQADIDSVQAELDALYAELLPEAQEVIDKFNAGESFDSLIEAYNDDPGMTSEPTASKGYVVKADSTYYDSAFVEGAMSIAEVGGISEPKNGMYGIYIVYYLADVAPGEVALEEIRDSIQESALSTKISETYDAAVSEWISALNPVYHFDRL